MGLPHGGRLCLGLLVTWCQKAGIVREGGERWWDLQNWLWFFPLPGSRLPFPQLCWYFKHWSIPCSTELPTVPLLFSFSWQCPCGKMKGRSQDVDLEGGSGKRKRFEVAWLSCPFPLHEVGRREAGRQKGRRNIRESSFPAFYSRVMLPICNVNHTTNFYHGMGD